MPSDSAPRFVGVIQARMGSTRLPHKVLADLDGQTMLEQIFARLKRCELLEEVVVATTTDVSDDRLVRFCEDRGLRVSRGPVDDIVQRIYDAAARNGTTHLVRVWGDCPFISPALIDEALRRIRDEGGDYATNSLNAGRTYPVGLDFEVYRLTLLRQILDQTEDPFFREFPFEFVAARGDAVTNIFLRHHEDLSDLNLTVDYAEDLELARELYRRLPADYDLSQLDRLARELDPRAAKPRNVEYHEKKQERSQ